MPVNADQMRSLMDLGIEGNLLLEIVTIFERDASRDGRDGKALAADRARKYRARQRDKSGMAGHVSQETSRQTSCDASRTERDGALTVSSLLSEVVVESKEETEGKNTVVVVERRKPTKRRAMSPLPDDWRPSAAHSAAASRLKISPQVVESKAEDMRLWAQSNDVRKANWDATFHGFLRRAANEHGGVNGKRIGTQGGTQRSGGADFFAGLAQVAADIDGNGPVARPAAEEIPVGRVNIDG